MKMRDYIDGQSASGCLGNYAERCGIAINYLRLHLKYARKNPSVELIKALARESGGKVSLIEVLDHYGITDVSMPRAVA